MSFFLFILVNATLFIRPAEIIPELLGVPIYNYLILACLALSLPEIVAYFTERPLESQPIPLCIFAVFLVSLISSFATLGGEEARNACLVFFKVMIYFVLLISLLNSEARIRQFVYWLLLFCLVLTVVTLLQYHEVIRLPTLKVLTDFEVDRVTGQEIRFLRLQGSGVFQDPNEFCLILAATVPLCLYALSDRETGVSKILWLTELGIIAYAIVLTKSRGGFLALMAGLAVVFGNRFGWVRTLFLGSLALPVLFLFSGSRQTSLSATQGTAQTRIQVWSDWMMEFRMQPLLGKGMTVPEEEPLPGLDANPGTLNHDTKLLAHNSFLQGFADLGLVGGTLFLGAFYLAVSLLFRLQQDPGRTDSEFLRLQPFLLGTVTAYSVGMLSLTLCYVIPTYLMLGLGAAYYRTAPASSESPFRLNTEILARLAGLSVCYLAAMYVFIRIFIRWA